MTQQHVRQLADDLEQVLTIIDYQQRLAWRECSHKHLCPTRQAIHAIIGECCRRSVAWPQPVVPSRVDVRIGTRAWR